MNNIYIDKAESYLQNCIINGLANSFDVKKQIYVKPYPEVTGYVLTYFCEHNIHDKTVYEMAKRLVSLQDSAGGWSSFFNTNYLYTFDTAQILNGLCKYYLTTNNKQQTTNNRLYNIIELAVHFIKYMQLENGAFVPLFDKIKCERVLMRQTYDIWNGPFSGIMLKCVESLIAANLLLNDTSLKTVIDRAANYYSEAEYIPYTHPLAYYLEGLLALGLEDKASKVVKLIIPQILENGFIPYNPSLQYSYVSGSMQLGIILYKLGYKNLAKSIRNYGRIVQSNHKSGGLFQYAKNDGSLDESVHTEINSWGTKYFCELERMFMEDDYKCQRRDI